MRHSNEFYEATDVNSSCFVFASAGSGKTKILVDRYVKSLFVGIKPSEILCLTFTNAASTEMKERIARILENLYINKDGFTEKYLRYTLSVSEVTDEKIKRAEKLFFEFQDNLRHLKITTIHSFCQSIIQKFPFEAFVKPNFEILDENEAQHLINEAKTSAITEVPQETISTLSKLLTIHSFEELINKVYQMSPRFMELFEVHKSTETHNLALQKRFNFTKTLTFTDKQLEFIETFLKNRDLEDAYLTKTGCLRKKIPFAENSISLQIAEAVFLNSENRKKSITLEKTHLFLDVVFAIIEKYVALKNNINALDFQDILQKTFNLLTISPASGFALSKICSRIKSVMIDEAQDLSTIQWQLVSLFSDDIFSDPHNNKTIFVVGDVKQSIYRFQGADYKLLSAFHKHCDQNLHKLGKKVKTVHLNMSYRSLPAVLEAVDDVFEGEISRTAFDPGLASYKRHVANKLQPKGTFATVNMAGDEYPINTIISYIKKQSENDILILTRSRNTFSTDLAKEIAISKIKIGPQDKILLNDCLLVLDLLAITDICIDENNEYALACILKSQYIFPNPLSNDDLFSLRHNISSTMFRSLSNRFPEIFAHLITIIEHYHENNLVEFFYYLTTIINISSSEDRNVISAFINEVLKFSERESTKISDFVEYFRNSNIQITNQNIDRNCVRLSTIHGAKGLEAKTVFILDFSLEADKSKTKLAFVDNTVPFAKNSERELLFFLKPSKNNSFAEMNSIIENEYMEERNDLLRLLYVAMTRARENLVVFGENNGKTAFSLIESNALGMVIKA